MNVSLLMSEILQMACCKGGFSIVGERELASTLRLLDN